MTLYLTIFMSIYFLLDAIHDKYVIEGRGSVTNSEKELMWHLVDALIKGSVSIFILFLLGYVFSWGTFFMYLFYIAFFRAIWFNFFLNLFRNGVGLFHIGNSGFEGIFVSVKWLYWVTCIIIYALSLYYFIN